MAGDHMQDHSLALYWLIVVCEAAFWVVLMAGLWSATSCIERVLVACY